MSCELATAPINIKTNEKHHNCSGKCAYSFSYGMSAVQIYNKTDYLKLIYDNPIDNKPVTFNTKPYTVNEIRLYQPSLHSWNGLKADAEMVIEHTTNGPGLLLVCIPIIGEGGENTEGNNLNLVIDHAKTQTANSGERSVLNITNFSLNDYVPQQSFFFYQGTKPYEPCNDRCSYVVFNNNVSSTIKISEVSLEALKKIISTNPYSTKSNNEVYINTKGALLQSTMTDNQIYIDCNPTDASGKEVLINEGGGIDIPASNIWTSISNTFNNEKFRDFGVFLAGFFMIMGIVAVILWIVRRYMKGKSTPLSDIELVGGRPSRPPLRS